MKKFIIAIITITILLCGILKSPAPSSGGGSGGGSGGLTAVNVGATLFVDSVNGSITGARGVMTRPFLSVSNAIQSSVSNDLIYVQNPGGYDFAEQKTNFVDYYVSGTMLVTNMNSGGYVMTGFIQDSNTLIANVYGTGNFIYSPPSDQLQVTPIYGSVPALLTLENTNSIVHFTCDSIICTNLDGNIPVEGSAINVTLCSSAIVNINSIFMAEYPDIDIENGQSQSAVNYTSGNVTMSIGNITTTNVDGLVFNDDSSIANLVNNGESISIFNVGSITVYGDGSALWWYGSTSAGQQEFINCPSILSQNFPAIMNIVGGGDKVYVQTSKLSSYCTVYPVIDYQSDSEGTNQLWLTSQKVTDNSGGGLLHVHHFSSNTTNRSNMKFHVDQWEEKSASYTKGWWIEAGTYQFFPGKLIMPNGVGLYMTNGDVTLSGITIDCSQHNSTTNNAIYIASGVLTLNDCTLITTNGVLGIAGTNSPVINVNGSIITGGFAKNLVWHGYCYTNGVFGTQ